MSNTAWKIIKEICSELGPVKGFALDRAVQELIAYTVCAERISGPKMNDAFTDAMGGFTPAQWSEVEAHAIEEIINRHGTCGTFETPVDSSKTYPVDMSKTIMWSPPWADVTCYDMDAELAAHDKEIKAKKVKK